MYTTYMKDMEVVEMKTYKVTFKVAVVVAEGLDEDEAIANAWQHVIDEPSVLVKAKASEPVDENGNPVKEVR